MSRKKEPWQIAAARFCVERSESGFKFSELQEYLKMNYSVKEGHIQQFIEEEIQTPSGRTYSRNARNESWTPPLDLVAKVTDYDELREARENARKAWFLSFGALAISTIGVIVQVFY